MTFQQRHNLKNKFIKLSQDSAPTSTPIPTSTAEANPYPGLSHGITDTGFQGVVNGAGNALASAGKSLWSGAEGLGGAGLSALKSAPMGLARGLGYGAVSNALPAAEGAVESEVGYKSNSNPMYDGVDPQTRQSLYLSQDPAQQDPKTRSWGNYIDQSLTSSGGVKNTINDGIAGSVWGLPGAAAMSALHAPSNLYSDAKGLYNLYNAPKGPNAGLSDQQIIDNAEAGHQSLNKQSFESWSDMSFAELNKKYQDKEHNHHLKLECHKCGNVQTCRCREKKELHYGLCDRCVGVTKTSEYEDLKTKIYQILHQYFNIKPPIPKGNVKSQDVKSSNIKAIGYNPRSSLLEVEFKNKTKYRYPFIDKEMYKGFVEASSKGKYFNEHIKPIGLYEKVAEFLINNRSTHSKGMYAPKDKGHEPGDFVGLAFKKIKETGNKEKDWIKTKLATKLNHTDKPNLTLKNNGTHYYFLAAKKINPNQEYTADHTKFPV